MLIINKVLENNPHIVVEIQKGNLKSINQLVGLVKKQDSSLDPKLITRYIKEYFSIPTVEKPQKTFPQFIASFMTNDLKEILHKRDVEIKDIRIPPEVMSYLLRLEYDGYIYRDITVASVEYMVDQYQTLNKIMDEVIGWINETNVANS